MNKQAWLQAAKVAGIEDFEIYEQGSTSTSIRLFEGDVDSFTISECKGFALRGIYHGKMGIYFLEEAKDELMDYAIAQVKQNASVITSNDRVVLYEGADSQYPQLHRKKNSMLQVSSEEKIALLKAIEKKALESDARITQVMSTNYGQIGIERAIDNTHGIHVHDTQHLSFITCSLMAKDKEDVKTAGDWMYLNDMKDIDVDVFVKNLSDKVLAKLYADTLTSGNYPVLIQNEAMADFFAALCQMFDGEDAYKGISILKHKIKEQVFSPCINIVDDPLKKDGYNSVAFDDEGVACYKKYLVRQGVLKTYLHNLKSAQLMDTTSTGNGFKYGYASSVGIQPTNLYIEQGNTPYDEMVKSMKKGVIITDITGLHAGIDTISTEFSIQSNGFYVENGQIIRPINLITIAGNFMEAMKHITTLGNDLKYNMSGIGAPSILFEQLSISGK